MNVHTGSNFDDFLAEEGILEEVSMRAEARLLAIQAEEIIVERMCEEGIATDLLASGVPAQEIVLGFRPPELRRYTEFAVA